MGGGAHLNMQSWSPEEDKIIREMTLKFGNKWKEIQKHLPDRTIPSIRNRYQRMQKGDKLQKEGGRFKNLCRYCGLPKRGHTCTALVASTANSFNGNLMHTNKKQKRWSKNDTQENSAPTNTNFITTGFSIEQSILTEDELLASDLFSTEEAKSRFSEWIANKDKSDPPIRTVPLSQYIEEVEELQKEKERQEKQNDPVFNLEQNDDNDIRNDAQLLCMMHHMFDASCKL